MNSRHRSLLLAAVLALAAGPVFAQASAEVQQRRQEIDTGAQEALDKLLAEHSGAQELYGRAAGYAVFTVTKGGFIVSGGGGNGVAVNKGTGQRTYMRMGMAGVGFGIGGQRYALVVLFETADRLNKFVAGGWDSSATAEAVAGQEGVAFRSSFIDGVAIFQVSDKGLMAWADVSGTKFWINEELR
jgi:lipid-binding SYLF domain-containing protein